MVENNRWLDVLSHIVLIAGVIVIALPLWVTFVASTHDAQTMLRPPVPLLPGGHLFENYSHVLLEGMGPSARTPAWKVLVNSLVMALGICIGKIAVSIIAAFAIVYFRFPFRKTAFWLIFVTLMLPVEVRIVPSYKVVADFGLLNSYGGMIVPLIASATATFLFRQLYLTVPDELAEAARVDGAGALRFFWDILLPQSRTTVAALFVIQFIYGWNQYLWPLLVTTTEDYYTMVMTVSRRANETDSIPEWNHIMTAAVFAMLPPVLVVMLMQRHFVRGLVDTEK